MADLVNGKICGICGTQSVSPQTPTSPTIQNFGCPIAFTFTQLTSIVSGVKMWQMKTKQASDMYYSFTPVTVASNFFNTQYMTINSGYVLSEATDVSVGNIYISVATTNTIVELETWR